MANEEDNAVGGGTTLEELASVAEGPRTVEEAAAPPAKEITPPPSAEQATPAPAPAPAPPLWNEIQNDPRFAQAPIAQRREIFNRWKDDVTNYRVSQGEKPDLVKQDADKFASKVVPLISDDGSRAMSYLNSFGNAAARGILSTAAGALRLTGDDEVANLIGQRIADTSRDPAENPALGQTIGTRIAREAGSVVPMLATAAITPEIPLAEGAGLLAKAAGIGLQTLPASLVAGAQAKDSAFRSRYEENVRDKNMDPQSASNEADEYSNWKTLLSVPENAVFLASGMAGAKLFGATAESGVRAGVKAGAAAFAGNVVASDINDNLDAIVDRHFGENRPLHIAPTLENVTSSFLFAIHPAYSAASRWYDSATTYGSFRDESHPEIQRLKSEGTPEALAQIANLKEQAAVAAYRNGIRTPEITRDYNAWEASKNQVKRDVKDAADKIEPSAPQTAATLRQEGTNAVDQVADEQIAEFNKANVSQEEPADIKVDPQSGNVTVPPDAPIKDIAIMSKTIGRAPITDEAKARAQTQLAAAIRDAANRDALEQGRATEAQFPVPRDTKPADLTLAQAQSIAALDPDAQAQWYPELHQRASELIAEDRTLKENRDAELQQAAPDQTPPEDRVTSKAEEDEFLIHSENALLTSGRVAPAAADEGAPSPGGDITTQYGPALAPQINKIPNATPEIIDEIIHKARTRVLNHLEQARAGERPLYLGLGPDATPAEKAQNAQEQVATAVKSAIRTYKRSFARAAKRGEKPAIVSLQGEAADAIQREAQTTAAATDKAAADETVALSEAETKLEGAAPATDVGENTAKLSDQVRQIKAKLSSPEEIVLDYLGAKQGIVSDRFDSESSKTDVAEKLKAEVPEFNKLSVKTLANKVSTLQQQLIDKFAVLAPPETTAVLPIDTTPEETHDAIRQRANELFSPADRERLLDAIAREPADRLPEISTFLQGLPDEDFEVKDIINQIHEQQQQQPPGPAPEPAQHETPAPGREGSSEQTGPGIPERAPDQELRPTAGTREGSAQSTEGPQPESGGRDVSSSDGGPGLRGAEQGDTGSVLAKPQDTSSTTDRKSLRARLAAHSGDTIPDSLLDDLEEFGRKIDAGRLIWDDPEAWDRLMQDALGKGVAPYLDELANRISPDERSAYSLGIVPGYLDIHEPIVKLWQAARNYFHTFKPGQWWSAWYNAAVNKAYIFARQRSNDVRGALKDSLGRDVTTTDERALTFVVESQRDKAKLAEFRDKIKGAIANPKYAGRIGWIKRVNAALDAIQHAEVNWDKLQAPADMYERFLQDQVKVENANGIDTPMRKGYVPHLQELESDFELPGAGSTGGTGSKAFKKMRSHATFADSLSVGIKPRTINAVDAMENRMRRGMRAVNLQQWAEAGRSISDPTTKKPVVASPILTPHPTGATNPQLLAPKGYQLLYMGFRPIAVHEGYSSLFESLMTPGAFRKGPIGKAVMGSVGTIKHGILLGDSFHLARLAFYQLPLRGKATFRKGLLMVDYSDNELRNMERRGELLGGVKADDVIKHKADVQLLTDQGYNIGSIQEAINADFIRRVNPLGLGKLNQFIFEQFQRGGMVESGVLELNRQRRTFPELSEIEVARKVSRELNTRFGNLGKEGWFKSNTARDLAQLVFLAPSWNEGLLKSEVGAGIQGYQFGKDAVLGRGLRAGALFKGSGSLFLGTFVMNQIINQVTRNKWTWENPEEGFNSKLSAYIPDFIGNGPGFFLNPLTLPAELTHQVLEVYERGGKTALESFRQVLGYKTSPGAEAFLDFWTRKDRFGRALNSDKDVLTQMVTDLTPAPISLSTFGRALFAMVQGHPAEAYPGAIEKQTFATVGVKLAPAPSATARVYSLAHKFLADKGLPVAPHTDPSLYKKLDTSLLANDKTQAQKEYDALINQGFTDQQIRQRYLTRPTKTFTGKKPALEKEFLGSLSDEQRDTYKRAIQQRRDLTKLFQDSHIKSEIAASARK